MLRACSGVGWFIGFGIQPDCRTAVRFCHGSIPAIAVSTQSETIVSGCRGIGYGSTCMMSQNFAQYSKPGGWQSVSSIGWSGSACLSAM